MNAFRPVHVVAEADRLVSIVECAKINGSRQVFTCGRQLARTAQVTRDQLVAAVSLVQAFEYELEPREDLQIVGKDGKRVALDYSEDETTNSVNLHLWAQIEDESGMTEGQANDHSRHATKALVDLFKGLEMRAERSVFTDGLYCQQLSMPEGIRFVELMTLGERFGLQGTQRAFHLLCIAKTCGAAGNLYVNGGPS